MIAIRKLKNSELLAYAKLRKRLWPFDSVQKHISETRELKRRRGFVAFIARIEGEDIGFLEAALRPYANGCEWRPVLFLEGIWLCAYSSASKTCKG